MASPFLTKRRAGWYLRIRVPADLVPVFGTHLTRSLATRDHSVARQRSVVAVAQLFEHWQDVRRTMAARWNGKEIDDLLPNDLIGADREKLDKFEGELSPEDRARLRARLAFLVHVVQTNVTEHQADVSALRELVHSVEVNRLKGEIEGLKGAVAVLGSGGRAVQPVSIDVPQLIAPITDAERISDHRGRRPWNDFVEEFFADRDSIGSSARQSHRQAFKELEVVVGRKAIADLTKGDIKGYANYLRDKPIQRAGRTRLSRDTIVKSLSHVRSYLAWTVESGIIEINPAEGVGARSQTREERDNENGRQAFNRKQLETLFDSPLFTGCLSDRRRSERGNLYMRDERYWFFLVGLLTGARVEELAEAPAALADLDGIACLDLRDVGKKTNNAPRLVPILPELKRLGFMEWAKTKEKGGKLFQGGAAFEDWSKGANRYIRSIGIDDPAIVFYSLRHNFRQMLNSAVLTTETADKIFGHGKKAVRSVGAGYGRALSGAEARLFVEKVKAQIDLSHLYPLPKS